MKTANDLFYWTIEPCWYCPEVDNPEPCRVCNHQTLVEMCTISTDMILKGEY